MSALRQLLLPIFVSSFFIILTTAVLTAALSPALTATQLEPVHSEISPTPAPAPTSSPVVLEPTPTVASQVAQVSDESATLAQLEKRLAAVEKQLQKFGQPQQVVAPSTAKTYSIFLGAGSTSNRDWTEIPATAFTLVTDSYPPIQTARFEASLKIIGGNATARLVNKTTGAIIAASEVTHSGSSLLTSSGTFSPPSGTNQLVVQLRSDSGELAVLEGARLQLEVR